MVELFFFIWVFLLCNWRFFVCPITLSFDAIEFSSTAQDQMEILGENKLTNESQPIEPIEIKDIDVGDYFSSLLKSSSKDSDFMNFAKKNAHNAYDAFSRNYIFDIEDFVEDLSSKM